MPSGPRHPQPSASLGTQPVGSSLGDVGEYSDDLETGDVDGRQPRLPVGVFNTLAAEFCSTVMAQAQQLDKMVDHVNRAQDQDGQLSANRIPKALGEESVINLSRHVKQEPAAVFGEVKEPRGTSSGPSRHSRDTGTSSQLMLRSKAPESFEVKRTGSLLSVQDARSVMRSMSVSLHLASPDKSKPSHLLFADIDEMKRHIRQAILKPYNVSQYYYADGICRRIAVSNIFEMMTLTVICVNALWIAIDADANGGKPNKEKPAFAQIVEWCFFTYFMGEILIRFGAFQTKLNCFKDFWFNFDAILVILMCVDALLPIIFEKGLGFNTSVIRLARLLKLARMARIARLLHRYPELNLLVRGIGIGARSVISSFILLILVVYVFAVAFRFLTIDTDVGREYFRSVPVGMKYLLLQATMPDAMDTVNTLGAQTVLNGVLYIVFITMATLTLLNMLIAILCEVIHSVAVLEKETFKVQLVKDHLCSVMEDSGMNHHMDDEMLITKSEFQHLLLNVSVVKVLHEVGVDATSLIDYVEFIFDGDGDCSQSQGLTFDKLVELICALGGANSATVKDVVDMRQVVLRQLFVIQESLGNQLYSLQDSVSKLIHAPSREKEAKDETLRMPVQTLRPEDINAFLEMVVSTWVNCVKSQIPSRESSSKIKEESMCYAGENLNASALSVSPVLAVDKLIEQKLLDAEMLLRSRFEDTNDSRIVDVLEMVKDLHARLEHVQNDIQHSKAQLGSFDSRAETIELRLRSTANELRGCEHRTNVVESGLFTLSNRTDLLESGLQVLRLSAKQPAMYKPFVAQQGSLQPLQPVPPPQRDLAKMEVQERAAIEYGQSRDAQARGISPRSPEQIPQEYLREPRTGRSCSGCS